MRRQNINPTWVVTSLAILTTVLWAHNAPGQTAEQIVEAHLLASGGSEALSRVKTLRRTGDINFKSEFTGSMAGKFEITIVPREKIYWSSEVGAFSTKTGWDGTTGWEQSARGLRKLEGDELNLLRAQSHLFFATGLWRTPHTKIERLADEDFDGAAHYVIEYSDENIAGLKVYIDQQTKLISQTMHTITLPNIGEVLVVIDFWDYQPYQGVMMPRAVSSSIQGLFSSETVFSETVINGPIDESQFVMPASGVGR